MHRARDRSRFGGGISLASQALAIARAAGGAFYNPFDMSSLFQDAAGSTPVTASGQSVRRVNDLTGNGFNAIAPSDAARPTLTIAGGLSYLDVNGTNNWMNVTPTLNLGEVWWHVGGWRADADDDRFFATSNTYRGASFLANTGRSVWVNSVDATVNIGPNTNGAGAANVYTVEQASTTSLSGRVNAIAGSTITPYDDSGSTQGVALFSASNSSALATLAGRFYGGAFAPGALTSGNRAIVEAYVAALAGVTL